MRTWTAIFGLTALSLIALATAQPWPRQTVKTTGTGSATFKNTIAEVRLSVSKDLGTAGAVQSFLATASTRLATYLRGAGVSKLKTTGVSLYARYNYQQSPARLLGYGGRSSVSFEVALERAGALLDGSVRAGATQISSVSFKAAPLVTAAARKKAISLAVTDARREAVAAATPLGKKVGPPLSIDVTGVQKVWSFASLGGGGAGSGSAFGSGGGGGGGGGGTQSTVIGGEDSVKANVKVVFLLSK